MRLFIKITTLVLVIVFLAAFPVSATDVKISDLTELSATPATDDVLPIVDTSSTTTKKITYKNLMGGVVNADAYGSLAAAVSAIGSTSATVQVTTAQTISADLTIPATLALEVLKPGLITVASGKILTVNGPFKAGSYQVFSHNNSDGVVFGSGSGEAHVQWWGWATGTGATQQALNSVAWQSALASNAPVVILPSGSYSYDTGITITRSLTLRGAGSTADEVTAGASETKLTYTGAGIGITIGSSAADIDNIHVSDFSLYGTASAAGGIVVGVGATYAVMHSSLKNIYISGFTAGYGYRTVFELYVHHENIFCKGNKDGFSFTGTHNACSWINVSSKNNSRNGYRFESGTVDGNTFTSISAEVNGEDGFYVGPCRLYKNEFIGYYSEQNLQTGGTAPITIVGASGTKALGNTWHGGQIKEIAIPAISLGYAERCSFNNFHIPFMTAGFLVVTANTVACTLSADDTGTAASNLPPSPDNITGYDPARISVAPWGAADYEEYTAASAACTGAVTAAAVWKAIRHGKSVTLYLPNVQSNGTAVTSFAFGTVLPARFRPITDVAIVSIPIIDNGASQSAPGMIYVAFATGIITVYRDVTTTTAFTVTATAGIKYPTSVTWNIQ